MAESLLKSPRFGFAVCCTGMMALAIGINLMPVFFTTFQAESNLTNEQLGRIPAVTFVGVVLAIFITGPLADRLGARLFALGGSVLTTLGLVLLYLSDSYATLLIASFLMGLGAGSLDMVLSPIVAALRPENRSSAMNWLHSYYCTGAVLTVFIAGASIKAGIGWRVVALLLTPLPLLVLLGFLIIPVPPLTDESSGRSRHRLRELIRVPWFIGALVAILLGGATEMGMANWLPAYAEKTLGYSTFGGSMAFAGFLAMMAIGRIAAGMIGSPSNTMRLMLLCCWGSVVLFLVGCFAPWPAMALGACILAGLAGSCLWPSMLAVAADRFPQGGGSMYGALAAAGNAGCIAMPWIVGIAADHLSMRIGLATGALCPLLMAFTLTALRPQTRP